tara:strand:- start:9021 stop:11171 length:2151 start_codon:yes stop_codon:yes gene_type:complete
MAKKKGEKQSEKAEEVRAFDKLDLKNQASMLDSLKSELGVRSQLKTEAAEQLNVSRQLQNVASDILAKQDAQILGLRKEKDISKDIEKTSQLISKLKRQANDDGKGANKIAQAQLEIARRLKDGLLEEEKARKKIEDKVGLTGKLLKGIAEIPILGKMVDTEKALSAMNEAAANNASSFKVMGAGIGSMATDFKKGMTDPLTIVTAMIKSGFAFDKQVTDLAKGLGMSRDEAKQMRHEFSNMATDLGEMSITSRDIEGGFNLVNSALGTASSTMRSDISIEAGRMQKLLGLSEESIMGFAGHAMRSGKEMKTVKFEALGALKAVEKQTGIRLNETQMLEKIGKVTGQISAQLGGDPARIMAAAAAANSLGMELEDVASAGKSMLNFEESISAELEAELLTGKQLNLEKARLAALTGDYETLTEEIAENVGDFGEYSKMNVLQQEALAKSVGMTADQLSNQLMKKADLLTLAEEARDAGEEETARMLEQRNAQEEMNDMISMMKESFVDMAGGPIGDFVKGLAEGLALIGQFFMYAKQLGTFIGGWASDLGPFLDKIGIAGKLMKGLAWAGVVGAAYKAYGAFGMIPFGLGVPFGLAASIAILAAGNAALNTKKADDASFEGGGYGKRAMYEKGSVTLFNDKDTIVAGTNLGGRKANDATFSPEGSNTNVGEGSGGGEAQPLSVSVQSLQQNDVFARTDKNTEDVYMVQAKSEGLFA